MAKLIPLPKSAISHIAGLGFRPIQDDPNTFRASVKTGAKGYERAATLTMLPLQLQRNRYVFTLQVNGDPGFSGRVGDLGDFDEWWAKVLDNSLRSPDVSS